MLSIRLGCYDDVRDLAVYNTSVSMLTDMARTHESRKIVAQTARYSRPANGFAGRPETGTQERLQCISGSGAQETRIQSAEVVSL